jgi:Spy/CpxP family protein refolding chaperone
MALKTRFFSILTVGISIAALSSFAMAQSDQGTTAPAKPSFEGKDRRGKVRGMKAGRSGEFGRGIGFLHGLNLTDAQKAQIKSIHQANKPDGSLRQELKAMREARRNGGTISDEQKARLQAIRQQQASKAKQVRDQILAVLTPEQRAQLDQRRQQMEQRRDQFRQKREQFRKNRPAVKTDTE